MKREGRYYVLKVKDAQAALDADEQVVLSNLIEKMDQHRSKRGASPLQCMVIEHDWPEYEIAWQLIERRVDGFNSTQDFIIDNALHTARNGDFDVSEDKIWTAAIDLATHRSAIEIHAMDPIVAVNIRQTVLDSLNPNAKWQMPYGWRTISREQETVSVVFFDENQAAHFIQRCSQDAKAEISSLRNTCGDQQ